MELNIQLNQNVSLTTSLENLLDICQRQEVRMHFSKDNIDTILREYGPACIFRLIRNPGLIWRFLKEDGVEFFTLDDSTTFEGVIVREDSTMVFLTEDGDELEAEFTPQGAIIVGNQSLFVAAKLSNDEFRYIIHELARQLGYTLLAKAPRDDMPRVKDVVKRVLQNKANRESKPGDVRMHLRELGDEQPNRLHLMGLLGHLLSPRQINILVKAHITCVRKHTRGVSGRGNGVAE